VPTHSTYKILYLLKVKGVAKIPDYVQLRDQNMSLLAYFRSDRPERHLAKIGLELQQDYIMSIVNELPFGKLIKLEL